MKMGNKIIIILSMLALTTSCSWFRGYEVYYETNTMDVKDSITNEEKKVWILERNKTKNPMYKKAIEFARLYGECFCFTEYDARDFGILDNGCIWTYVLSDSGYEIKAFTFRDGKVIKRQSFPYDRNIDWLSSMKSERDMFHDYWNFYGLLLDAYGLDIYRYVNGKVIRTYILANLTEIKKYPGLDPFLDEMMHDVYKYEIIPRSWYDF